jgi:hypothetical protein
MLFTHFPLYAGPTIQHDFLYFSSTDNVENGKYQTMRNYFFIGAKIGAKDLLSLGQSVLSWNRSQTSAQGSQSDISLLELGPRLIYHLGSERRFFISLAYHPYVKGTRTVSSGTEETISGHSLLGSFTAQVKLGKRSYIGASLHYHQITISESKQDTTTSDVANTYSWIYPTISLGLRY